MNLKITKENYQRYHRQIIVPDIGINGQLKLQEAKVLVIGAGGLGSPVLLYLAGAGIGTLGIADHDTVAIHNLHRQILHRESSVDTSKAQSALESLQQLNSTIQYHIHEEAISSGNATNIISGYDLVVDGSDNFATRYLVNDTCVALDKPLVYGSILGFEGQVAVFNHNGGKHLGMLFPEPPPAELVPNCGENGVLGPLPGIIGTMMAQEALKLLTGLPVLHNQLLIFNTLHWTFRKIVF
ncbi:putative adenylyltransferase/sulfurtransferase MoeZ [compost metagenome]